MKNKKLLFVASLLSVLSLAGCTVEEFCGTNNNQPPATTEPEPSEPEVATDIFGNVIPGLDRSDKNTSIHTFQKISGKAGQEGGTQTYSGAIAGYVDGNVAYGWTEYTVEEWYSTYGVAVKVTFSDEGKALSLQIGASSEGAHNFTPSYATTAPEAYKDYLNNLQKNTEKIVIGKTSRELVDALKDVKIDVTAAAAADQFVPADGSILGAGATQTETRVEGAVLAAAASWLIDHDPINNTTFEPVSSYWADKKDTITDKAVANHVTSSGDKYYSSTVYSGWGNFYGIALEATVQDKKITDLKFGVPFEGAHNYTPMYADGNLDLYLNYLDKFEKAFKDHIINKELTAELVAGASIDLTVPAKDGFHSIPGLVSAGETQSYARASVALANLVNEILK